MPARQPVVRKCSKISKPQLHDLLMIGWQRAISKFGKGPWAEALEITTVAVDKQLAASMPDFATIVDAYAHDDEVLNEILAKLGVRIVPKEATCDTDDLNLLLSRLLVKVNEATHPDSPGGRKIVHSEYLDGEMLMRAIHKVSGAWIEKCAELRGERAA